MQPPIAPQRPHTHREHGVERDDPWHWLRDRDDPATLAYIEAENRYAEHAMAPLAALRDTLYDEMLARIQETYRTASIPDGPWAYYRRTEAGRPYTLHCREPRDGGDEQLLLDENALAEGHDFFHLGALVISPDHQRAAYTVDTTGAEIYTLYVRDLATGAVIDEVAQVGARVVWGNDSASLFWSELDATQRPWRIRRRRVGGGARDADEVLYEDADGRFYVWISRSRAGRHLVVCSAHAESVEAWLLDGDAPDAPLRCIQPRTDGLYYLPEVDHERVWIRSNDGDDPARRAPGFRLYAAPLDAPGRANWRLVRDAPDGGSLQDVSAFRDHLVLEERRDGVVQLLLRDRTTGAERRVAMPEDSYVAGLSHNPEYDAPWIHFSYSSMVRPQSLYRHHLADDRSELLEQVPVPTYDPTAMHSARVHATAADGTQIPISLLWKGDATPPSGRPCMLYGYGSYGLTVEPSFRATWLSLVERGVVVGIAHIRGGGYHGRAWYEAAKFLTKEHTFDDFVVAARHLCASGVTAPERLGIMGGSAGGMLVGAVINRAPGLCAAAVASVPFVDVVSTMLDASLPLTSGEWQEWGDPRDPTFFHAMLAYSPYDNVRDGVYPDLLITSGLNDPRVQYWEPTKWTAKLRATVSGSEVLLVTHIGAGHQGQSGRYGYLRDAARDQAWLLSKLGATERR